MSLLLLAPAALFGDAFSFTAADIAAAAGPLHNSTFQWGIWAVRAMPVVTGGGYTITSETTTQTGWGASLTVYGNVPYGPGDAWFYDYSGSERAGTPANPLYMITDMPADTFTSYTFNSSGVSVGSVPPDPVVPPQAGGGGTNVVTQVDPASLFTVNFDLDPGATWNGQFQFVVDGSKYHVNPPGPAQWVEDFFGGYTEPEWSWPDYGSTSPDLGGGLPNNYRTGFTASSIPEPGSVILLATVHGAVMLTFRRRLARS